MKQFASISMHIAIFRIDFKVFFYMLHNFESIVQHFAQISMQIATIVLIKITYLFDPNEDFLNGFLDVEL